MKIPIEALELWRFASTDVTRPQLDWIEIKEGKATACDGHILGQVKLDDQEPQETLYLKASELKVLLKRATKKERLGGAVLDSTGKLDIMGLGPQAIEVDENPGFPDVHAIIPPAEENSETGNQLYLDVDFMTKIHDWVKATNTASKTKLTITGRKSPMRFDFDQALFVLMPCMQ